MGFLGRDGFFVFFILNIGFIQASIFVAVRGLAFSFVFCLNVFFPLQFGLSNVWNDESSM